MERQVVINTARRGRARAHTAVRRIPERTGKDMKIFGPRLRTYESVLHRRQDARRYKAATHGGHGGRGGRGGTIHRRTRPGSMFPSGGHG